MTQAVADVSESQAEGKIKTTYEDIKQTLRVPAVPYLFRAIARHPDFLSLAWSALKPNAQTIYFERQADSLRQSAVTAAPGLGSAPEVESSARDVVRTMHYEGPKAFLATATLRSAIGGSQPQMRYLPAEEKRQTPPGIPKGATVLNSGGQPASTDSPVSATLEDMSDAGVDGTLGAELAALHTFPAALEAGWMALKPMLGSGELSRVGRELRMEVERAITALPYRMDIGTHTLIQGGLSHADVDDIRAVLDRCYAVAPSILLMIASLAIGMDGRDTALMSPFPV